MLKNHFPGIAVAIAHKDMLWTKGSGYSNLEAHIPVDPKEDLFRIGSISKLVTAVALARLVQEKRIDLDVPIST